MKRIIIALIITLVMTTASAFAKSTDSDFGVGANLGLVDGNFAYGVVLDYMFPIEQNIKIGIESGFTMWSAGVSGLASATAWVIPIAPKLTYHFSIDGASIKPYVGASLGIGIVNVGNVTVLNSTVSNSSTSVKFNGMLHGGFDFGDADAYFTELKLGAIASSFSMLAVIGLYF